MDTLAPLNGHVSRSARSFARCSSSALIFTETYGRILAPGLVQLDHHLPAEVAARSPLATAWCHLDHTLDNYISCQIAAVGDMICS